MDKNQLSVVYDTIYEAGNQVLRRYDPCKIEMVDGKVTCANTRSNPGYDGNTGQLCCTGCRHLGPEGCTVQALWCKLWTCTHLQNVQNPVIIPLNALRASAREMGLNVHEGRYTKDEVLTHVDRDRKIRVIAVGKFANRFPSNVG